MKCPVAQLSHPGAPTGVHFQRRSYALAVGTVLRGRKSGRRNVSHLTKDTVRGEEEEGEKNRMNLTTVQNARRKIRTASIKKSSQN